MEVKQLLEILHVASLLKKNTRHCYIEDQRKESVADHSWRISLLAMLVEHEFKELDMNRVIRMCLIHDLGEAFTGDIPTFVKTDEDSQNEYQIYLEWVKQFPEAERNQWMDLLDEMERLETKEAKLYKALDKMEAVISHNESNLATWLPLEYDLQFTYGTSEVAFSDYLKEFKAAIDEETTLKIKKGQ